MVVCFLQVNDKLKSLPHALPQLLQVILARLEADLCDENLVATALSLIVCARNGALTTVYLVVRPQIESEI